MQKYTWEIKETDAKTNMIKTVIGYDLDGTDMSADTFNRIKRDLTIVFSQLSHYIRENAEASDEKIKSLTEELKKTQAKNGDELRKKLAYYELKCRGENGLESRVKKLESDVAELKNEKRSDVYRIVI